MQPGQIRLGEHTDYGSFTLLFQDNVGGLQLEQEGHYVDAVPMQDAIFIIIGESLNLLSGGLLKSKKHRVMVPEDEVRQKLARHSYTYFVDPDEDVVINHQLLYKDESKNKADFKKLPPPYTFKQLCLERCAKIYAPI